MKKTQLKLLCSVVAFMLLCLLLTISVAVLLHTRIWITQKAYLYRLLAFDGASGLCLLFLLPLLFRRWLGHFFTVLEQLLLVSLSTLFVAMFLSLGLMPMERSYTVYSLADMADHPTKIYSAVAIKEQFIEGYIEKANESQKRIDEQVYIGNLEKIEGGYRITSKGKRLISLYRFLADIFPLPDEHSIYPNGRK